MKRPALVVVAGIAAGLLGHGPAVFAGSMIRGDAQGIAAAAPNAERREQGLAMARKAIAYLRTQQDGATGGWSVPPAGEPGKPAASGRPHFPAITALVLRGMLMSPEVANDDPAVRAGLKYMLSYRQPDGGIYDRLLPSYNTSIALVALGLIDDPAAREAIKPAQDFIRSLQFHEGTDPTVGGEEKHAPVNRDHPFYGGIGYGRHGRPDLSNLGWMLEGMHASGVPSDDPAFQRALVFLQRCQMVDSVNDMAYADGSKQGGFIYATAENRDTVGQGQSFAGTIEETLDDGTRVSRLRSYGSMTYSGFKSYLYAGLAKDDLRVVEALRWISEHYTLEENPGLGTDALYYYLVVFARAMHAYGEPTINVTLPDGSTLTRNWSDDLIERLSRLQNEDGSFRSVDDRWMENDPVLITAYALVALQNALDARPSAAAPGGTPGIPNPPGKPGAAVDGGPAGERVSP